MLLLLAPSLFAQTAAPPSVLTLNTLTATTSITSPTIKLGNGGPYTLKLPTAAPSQNALFGIQKISGGVAQAQWVKGYNGTLKITAACTLTVVNGLITGKAGAC